MTDVQILLYDGLDELDAVAPLEVLGAAGFHVTTVAVDAPASVTGAHGLRLGVDGGLGDPPTLLVLPGGGWLAGSGGGARAAIADGRIPAWVAACHDAGTVLASVCSGTFFLTTSGVLGDRPATTHHDALAALRETGAEVHEEARVVDDGDVLSAGGVTSGLDLALHLVERYRGPEAATAGSRRIEHERRGPVLVTERGAAHWGTRATA